MRSRLLRLTSIAFALAAAVAMSADAPTPRTDKPARASCINQCTTKDAKCGSEVRRARQECSRNAANAGRDPMTMRRNYTYFCGHFSNPGVQCGVGYYASGCVARYEHRYAVCLDDMNHNIAAMRYDCYTAERDATRMCRDELQDCKRACGAE